MNAITLTVNGAKVSAEVSPRTHLADFLREQLNLTGTHLGCEQGVCGACTVMIDGRPQRSCIAFAAACDGSEIRTIEGFDDDPVMADLRDAFSRHHALQCGFCTPGMLMSSRDIVTRLGESSEATIREELSGNLCRCTGYVGIVGAVHAVAKGRVPEAAGAAATVEKVAAPAPSVAALEPAPAGQPLAGSKVSDAKGWSEIAQAVKIVAPAEAVWPALKDLDLIARCLPGAEINSFDGKDLQGKMVVRFGPIKAAFAGEATVAFDDASRSGSVSGGGRDGGSGSQAKGEILFVLKPLDSASSEVALTIRYRLTGALAQFSRGALVQNLVGHLADLFARNLAASLGGAPADVRVEKISFFKMLGAVIAGLFRPHPGGPGVG